MVAPAELPRSMAALKPAERKEEIAKKAKDRENVLKQIAKVSAERDAFLKKSPEKPTGFDGEVQKTVERAGAAAGMKF